MPSALSLPEIEKLLMSVAMTSPRLIAIFAILPFLSGRLLTGLTRNGLVLMLALFLSPMAGDLPESTAAAKWLIGAKEGLIGLLLALGFGAFIWAIQSVGDLIDFQTGSGNAIYFDPVGGHEGGPSGGFLGWLAVTLFVAVGGLTAMLGVIVDSYRWWPVTSFYPDAGRVLEAFVIREGDALFQWIVKLSAPIVLTLILVEMGVGLIGRIAPQLNVFVISQPLKSLLATLMLLLSLYFVLASLQEFLRPASGVVEFLRLAL